MSNEVEKANPLFDVIIVSSMIAGFAPSIIAMAVTTAVQIAARTAKELQARSRRNTYLDRVNQEVFMPRGLFAVVMKFKSDSQLAQASQKQGLLGGIGGILGTMVSSERLDFEQAAARYSQAGGVDPSRTQRYKRNLRVASGETRGEIEMTEAAELIFPDIETALDLSEATDFSGKSKAKLKSANKVVQGYLDRRAQAKYSSENPDSVLSTPAPKFASRFSDPTSGAHNGGLLGLVSGGAINVRQQPRGSRRGIGGRQNGGLIGMGLQAIAASRERTQSPGMSQRDERYDNHNPPAPYGGPSRGVEDYNSFSNPPAPYGGRPRRTDESRSYSNPYGGIRNRRRQGGIKKLMQQDVLYLIIVNLPSEEETRNNICDLERAMRESMGSKD